MVEYSVILKRHKGSSRPDVCIYSDENRDQALKEMRRYCKTEGFAVRDHDGRFTVADIVLRAKQRIVGAPILSEESYHELFDD